MSAIISKVGWGLIGAHFNAGRAALLPYAESHVRMRAKHSRTTLKGSVPIAMLLAGLNFARPALSRRDGFARNDFEGTLMNQSTRPILRCLVAVATWALA